MRTCIKDIFRRIMRPSLPAALVLGGLLVSAGEAGASDTFFFPSDPVYANVMIIFDTSSSMTEDTSGNAISGTRWSSTSGTADYLRVSDGGNHKNSKLYQAKQALQAVLPNVSGVNFGLATYAQSRVNRLTAWYTGTVPATNTYETRRLYNAAYQDVLESYQSANTTNSFVDRWNCTRGGGGFGVGDTFTVTFHKYGESYTPSCSDRRFDDTGASYYPVETVTLTYTVIYKARIAETGDYKWRYQSNAYIHNRWNTIASVTAQPACTDPGFIADPWDTSITWAPYTSQCLDSDGNGLCDWNTGAATPNVGSRDWQLFGASPNFTNTCQQRPVTAAATTGNTWVNWDYFTMADYTAGRIDVYPRDYTNRAPNQSYADCIEVAATGGTPVPQSGTGRYYCYWNIATGSIYDSSYFNYPGVWQDSGSAGSRPHGWSYSQVRSQDSTSRTSSYSTTNMYGTSVSGYVYNMMRRYCIGTNTLGSPYNCAAGISYPASVTSPDDFVNTIHASGSSGYDDNIVFLDLPHDGSGHPVDDTTYVNRKKIIYSYMDIRRYQDNPRNSSSFGDSISASDTDYDYTTMPYSGNLSATVVDGISYPNLSIAPSNLAANCDGGTPLAATLNNAKLYYDGYKTADQTANPTAAACRKNFVLLLTDGLESSALTNSGTTRNSDAAGGCDDSQRTSPGVTDDPVVDTTAAQTAATSLAGIGVKTYVIGFGVDPTGGAALNNIASSGGTTQAYFAADLTALQSALTQTFASISEASYTRSNPVITRGGNAIYQAYFDYPGWKGHLVKRSVSTSTQDIGGVDTNWSGNGDAGERMNTSGRGSIYTTTGTGVTPTRTDFTTANAATLKSSLITASDDIDGNGTPNETADAETVISYVLDPDHSSGAYRGARGAGWKLGDIFHSTPVIVGPPSSSTTLYSGYDSFKTSNSTRPVRVYVGANDGMLHAFDDTDGHEAWAYIPKMVLANLKNLKNNDHSYFVDSTPKVADIYAQSVTGSAYNQSGWHSVLVGGMRNGGTGYFALDVTDATNPVILWEVTHANMGYTWSTPVIGRVASGSKWVAFVGGGYSTTAGVGNSFYVIEIETGTILKSFTGVSGMGKVPSAPRIYDSDGDGNVNYVFFGDTNGKMWKVDVTGASTADWAVSLLFDPASPSITCSNLGGTAVAATARPIYYPPYVMPRQGDNTLVLLFGTGDENDAGNQAAQNFFYEIDINGNKDWCVAFDPGESNFSQASAFNNAVYFSTYKVTNQCDATGQAYLWGLSISTAAAEPGGDGKLMYDSGGVALSPGNQERISIGTGVPTAPVVTNGAIYYSTSSDVSPNKILIPGVAGRLKSWREIY